MADDHNFILVAGRPQEREAMQYDGTAQCATLIRHWVRRHNGFVTLENYKLQVHTPEAPKLMVAGDWAVHINNNNFRVFSNEVFVDIFAVVPD